MFNSELLNQIMNAIPIESSAVKVKALCLFTLLDELIELDLSDCKELIFSARDIQNILKD